MLNHHFATRAPNHGDPRAPRARTLCPTYPPRRSGGDRRAPRAERKALDEAGCSSHASRYRIPRRSRRDHSERPLPSSAQRRPVPLRMLSPRAAPPPGSPRVAAAPGFARRPTGRGGGTAGVPGLSVRAGRSPAGSCGSPASRLYRVGRVPAESHQHV